MSTVEKEVLDDSLVVRTNKFMAFSDWSQAQKVRAYLVDIGYMMDCRVVGTQVYMYLIVTPSHVPDSDTIPPHDPGH